MRPTSNIRKKQQCTAKGLYLQNNNFITITNVHKSFTGTERYRFTGLSRWSRTVFLTTFHTSLKVFTRVAVTTASAWWPTNIHVKNVFAKQHR
jgi:hypothetical protein